MTFTPKKAKRAKQKAVVGFIAPSGAGKTVGMLRVAYGMMKKAHPELPFDELWEKIGVVDTEHGRAQLYANETFEEMKVGEFLHIDFDPPYSTKRYNDAVKALKEAGCEVIIIDSLSHNWQGEGGIIETHSKMDGNSFQNWGKMSTETTSLVKTLTRNNVHILASLRTKQEYVVELNDKGKAAPRKVGLKPVQKDDLEYEFMINFNIDMNHKAYTVKDNSRIFEGHTFTLDEEVGEKLYLWLEEGVDVKEQEHKKRLEKLAYIGTLRKENEQLEFIAKDFEEKASAKLGRPITIGEMLEKMPGWFDGAYEKINKKAEELTQEA